MRLRSCSCKLAVGVVVFDIFVDGIVLAVFALALGLAAVVFDIVVDFV